MCCISLHLKEYFYQYFRLDSVLALLKDLTMVQLPSIILGLFLTFSTSSLPLKKMISTSVAKAMLAYIFHIWQNRYWPITRNHPKGIR